MFFAHNLESFCNALFDWRQMETEILFKLSPCNISMQSWESVNSSPFNVIQGVFLLGSIGSLKSFY